MGVKIVLRALPLTYMVAVWIMSNMPTDAVVELPKWDYPIKESLHLVEFGILYVLLILALLTFTKLTPIVNFILIGVACLYGIVDEIHQSFIPYRSATIIDVVKDIAGVLIASWIIYSAYENRRFPKLHRLLHKIETNKLKSFQI